MQCIGALLIGVILMLASFIFALALADASSLTDAPTGRADDDEDWRQG